MKGTRISIETLLYDALHRHRTPDDIVATYPSLTLEPVDATLTSYLHNHARLNAYLVAWYAHTHGAASFSSVAAAAADQSRTCSATMTAV